MNKGVLAAELQDLRKREIKFPSTASVHKFSGPVSHYADGQMQQPRLVLVMNIPYHTNHATPIQYHLIPHLTIPHQPIPYHVIT